MKPKNKETLSSPGRFGFLTEPMQSVPLILNFTIVLHIYFFYVYSSLDNLISLEVMKSWQCSPVKVREQMLGLPSKTVFRGLLC